MSPRHTPPFFLLPLLAGLLLPPGCGKEDVPARAEEVKLHLWQNPPTKTSAVTQLSTVFWGTTTGGDAEGSLPETAEWTVSCVTVTEQTVSTGRYIDAAAPGTRNYYVANVDFTLEASPSLSAENTTDIVAGRVFGSASSAPSVTLHHIFARLGDLTLTPPPEYGISGISWSLQGKEQPFGTAGTYHLSNGTWSGCSGLESALSVTSGSDLYLVPGTYTLMCRYTLSRNGNEQEMTAQADVSLQEGKINHISGTAAGGSLADFTVSVEVVPWGPSYLTEEES